MWGSVELQEHRAVGHGAVTGLGSPGEQGILTVVTRQEAKARSMPTGDVTYEIELLPGEQLRLPPAVVESVGPGHWLVTITPLPATRRSVRDHAAFLNSYVAEDEGLYDDYPAR